MCTTFKWWMFSRNECATQSKNETLLYWTHRRILRWALAPWTLCCYLHSVWRIFFFVFFFHLVLRLHVYATHEHLLQLGSWINRFQEIALKDRCEHQRRTHIGAQLAFYLFSVCLYVWTFWIENKINFKVDYFALSLSLSLFFPSSPSPFWSSFSLNVWAYA